MTEVCLIFSVKTFIDFVRKSYTTHYVGVVGSRLLVILIRYLEHLNRTRLYNLVESHTKNIYTRYYMNMLAVIHQMIK